MAEPHEPTVLIHGDPWKLADIADAIADCRGATWVRRAWTRRPALVHRGGTRVSLYIGQQFDPTKIDLVPDGWSHDHCEICWWELCEGEDPEHAIGYTDGHRWICTECYQRFVGGSSVRV